MNSVAGLEYVSYLTTLSVHHLDGICLSLLYYQTIVGYCDLTDSGVLSKRTCGCLALTYAKPNAIMIISYKAISLSMLMGLSREWDKNKTKQIHMSDRWKSIKQSWLYSINIIVS